MGVAMGVRVEGRGGPESRRQRQVIKDKRRGAFHSDAHHRTVLYIHNTQMPGSTTDILMKPWCSC